MFHDTWMKQSQKSNTKLVFASAVPCARMARIKINFEILQCQKKMIDSKVEWKD